MLKRIMRWWRGDTLEFKSIGLNVNFSDKLFCANPENVRIGNNVHIGPHATFHAMGNLVIGNGTMIGPYLTVYTANHRFRNATAIPYDEVVIAKDVNIDEYVWIGGNVIIMPGVTIGEGAIVGAGSVVANKIPPFSIVAGNPAKVIGHRDIKAYQALKAQGKIYRQLKKASKFKVRIIPGTRR